MKTINLSVDQEYVKGAGIVVGAMGSVESTNVVVDFTGWDDLSIYATMKDAKGNNPVVVILGFDKIIAPHTYQFSMPANALKEEGLMTITFTGYEVVNGNEVGALTNTATAKLRVLPSDAILAEDNSIDATLAMQLQAYIDGIKGDYEQLPAQVERAQGFADSASLSATSASESANNAANSETAALNYKNACDSVYHNLEGGFINNGRCDFEDLPSLDDCDVGDMFIINDDFTTTSDFAEGAGVEHLAGTEVFKIKSNKWDTRTTDVAALEAEVEDIQDDITTINGNIDTLSGNITALEGGKVDKVNGKGLSTNDYTTAEKNKLSGIAAGANQTIVDNALSSSSANPVMNSVVTGALNGKANLIAVRTMVDNSYINVGFPTGVNRATITRQINVAYSGWTPIAIVGILPKDSDTIISEFYLSGNTAVIVCSAYRMVDEPDIGLGACDAPFYVNVLYIKN